MAPLSAQVPSVSCTSSSSLRCPLPNFEPRFRLPGRQLLAVPGSVPGTSLCAAFFGFAASTIRRKRAIRPAVLQRCSAVEGAQEEEPCDARSARLGLWLLAASTSMQAGPARAAISLGPLAKFIDNGSWESTVEKYAPEPPPVRSTSGEAEIALAKHLNKVGATCRCTWWSRDCQELREAFGKEAAEIAPFVDCEDKNRELINECVPFTPYPTWAIEMKPYSVELTLRELAKISGFKEYPLKSLPTDRGMVTNYIWN